MRKIIFIWVSMGLLFLHGVCLAKTPHRIAGFVLGSSVGDYQNMVRMETDMPVPHKEYLRNVQTKELDGYSGGHVCYGTCKSPGRILQIQLKYSDSSMKFYNALLKQFRQRFGKPIELRGDPFHLHTIWKWSFTDTEKNRISLILRHNTMDPRCDMGNCVELTMCNLIDEERCFFEKEHPKHSEIEKKKRIGSKEWSSVDWNRFVPR